MNCQLIATCRCGHVVQDWHECFEGGWGMDQPYENTFHEELRSLINRHSRENQSDTPDYILASFMESCLYAFENAMSQRTAWIHQGPVHDN